MNVTYDKLKKGDSNCRPTLDDSWVGKGEEVVSQLWKKVGDVAGTAAAAVGAAAGYVAEKTGVKKVATAASAATSRTSHKIFVKDKQVKAKGITYANKKFCGTGTEKSKKPGKQICQGDKIGCDAGSYDCETVENHPDVYDGTGAK